MKKGRAGMSICWEKNLKAALLLVRNLRLQAVMQGINPKAVRVALKFALIVDDYLSRERLTREEDENLTEIAKDLFRKTPKDNIYLV